MKCICSIHDTIKPDICKNYPTNPGELEAHPNCGYYFENDILKGKCNQCGMCCKTPYIYPPGYTRKYKDESCPYLIED